MKKYLKILLIALVMVFGVSQMAESKTPRKRSTTTSTRPRTVNGEVNDITPKEFKILVADWSRRPHKFKGRRPAVVDFYASWCGPCKRVSPILDKLARMYSGRVDFYKIDGDLYPEIMRAYGFRSFPTVTFWAPGRGIVDKRIGGYDFNEYYTLVDFVLSISY